MFIVQPFIRLGKKIKMFILILIAILSFRIHSVIMNLIDINQVNQVRQEKGYKQFTPTEHRLSISPLAELPKDQQQNINQNEKKNKINLEVYGRHWTEIKQQKELITGRKIKPVQRKKPLTIKDLEHCHRCQAPREYLGLYGQHFDKKVNRSYQKIICNICGLQQVPELSSTIQSRKSGRISADRLYCPFCYQPIQIKKRRKSGFEIYKCINSDCSFKTNQELNPQGYRYTYRKYSWQTADLVINSPLNIKKEVGHLIDINQIKTPLEIVDKALTIRLSGGLSLRDTARLLQELYNIEVNYESIRQWELSLAYQLFPLYQQKVKLPLSGLNVFDETYLKYLGKWGYLFAAKDAIYQVIIGFHFSKKRDARAATIIAQEVDRQLKEKGIRNYTNIRDAAPIYNVAFDWIRQNRQAEIKDIKLKGIFSQSADVEKEKPWRNFKQSLERYFSTYKLAYKRKKQFGSINGVVCYSFLHMLYYNHLRPHQSLDKKVPAPLYFQAGQRVKTWSGLVRYLTAG